MSTPSPLGPRRGALVAAVLAVVVVVAYGSLFPFRFDAAGLDAWRTGALLGWQRPSRGDLVANLILYAPLGALLARLFLGASRAVAALLAIVAGTALSLAIETLQAFAPDRTSSLVDVALNATSTALGAFAVLVWLRTTDAASGIARVRARWLREPLDAVAVTVLLTSGAAHTAPFVPHADLQTAWQALAPLREFALTPQGLLEYFAGTLLLGSVMRATLRRERFWAGFLAFTLVCIACRVLFVRQNLGPNEPLALALAIPVLAVLRQLPNERTGSWVLAWSGFAWAASALAPFDFHATATEFGWRPFAGFLTGDVETGYLAFLEKAGFYAGWAWLAAYAGVSRVRALLAGVAVLAGAEAAQTFLPGRTAEITEPLLFATVAIAVWLLAPARDVRRDDETKPGVRRQPQRARSASPHADGAALRAPRGTAATAR